VNVNLCNKYRYLNEAKFNKTYSWLRNELIYGTLFYVIIYGSQKLLIIKTSTLVFGPCYKIFLLVAHHWQCTRVAKIIVSQLHFPEFVMLLSEQKTGIVYLVSYAVFECTWNLCMFKILYYMSYDYSLYGQLMRWSFAVHDLRCLV